MSRVGNGALESTKGALDGLAVTDVDLDVHVQRSGGAGAGGVCSVCVCVYALCVALRRNEMVAREKEGRSLVGIGIAFLKKIGNGTNNAMDDTICYGGHGT